LLHSTTKKKKKKKKKKEEETKKKKKHRTRFKRQIYSFRARSDMRLYFSLRSCLIYQSLFTDVTKLWVRIFECCGMREFSITIRTTDAGENETPQRPRIR